MNANVSCLLGSETLVEMVCVFGGHCPVFILFRVSTGDVKI